MLQQLFDQGEIYQAEYRGFYSTRQEQFLQEKDRLPDGAWPEIFGEVTEIVEANYFFKKLRQKGQYQDWLVQFLTVTIPWTSSSRATGRSRCSSSCKRTRS